MDYFLRISSRFLTYILCSFKFADYTIAISFNSEITKAILLDVGAIIELLYFLRLDTRHSLFNDD